MTMNLTMLLELLDAIEVRTLERIEEARDDGFVRGCKVGYGDKREGIEMARQEGYDAARAAAAELSDEAEEAAYNQGFEHGHAQGYDEGYNEGAADSYDDGYSGGYSDGFEAGEDNIRIRAAEAAAFEDAFNEPPRIHNHVEGAKFE